MQKFLEIYCDGACSGNPGPGGWGAVLLWDNKMKKISGFEKHTTNNQMELTAAIEALKVVKRQVKIKIYTDSIYLKKGITEWIKVWAKNNWNNGKVKNIAIWQALSKICEQFEIEWHWVKGHNGDIYNEMADKLARQEIEKNI
jgi:ribonuclease HI